MEQTMGQGGLISIIVPVYNVRPYLEEALDSVLCQSYGKLEIILVDDGSADGSGEVCDSYAKRDARVIVLHQENRGLSAARNAGLDRMTGEAVAFLDPDDAYDPCYIEAMWHAMLQERADMVVSKYTVHTTVDKLFRKGREKASPPIEPGMYDRLAALRALADGTINVSVWNKLYRHELWTDLRFPEGHVYEDIFVACSVIEGCDAVCVLDRPLYLHRKRPGSITDTVSSDNLRDWEQAYARHARFIEENTPGIFTPAQCLRVQSGMLGGMIGQYVRCFGRADIDSAAMRERIMALGGGIGAGGLKWKTRVALAMLRSCPWLLRTVYPMYRPIRQLVYRVFGR